ncbi:porin [Chitinophaga rhizosphaerae]|uniref:porin n=1 Tax=Chitinophaga rhizosphaerae TaxID=1864947 RepID=UPI00196A4027|nr:porin [Chitinophaga rhizosphaerae]
MRTIVRTGFLVLFLSTAAFSAKAQFLMDMIDTTTELGKGMISIYKRYDHLRISGYMQPQFQYASDKGIESFAGGDFNKQSDNRFMLRRGRVRFDYAHFNKRDLPTVQFVFQFDGTERGVNIRDFWGRFFDGRWDVMALTMGMFARPFGYEVNFSSSDREAPERGRMSQILMKSERDMGGMLTFEPRSKSHPLHYLKVDVGLFNGQGLSGPSDFDSHKDVIARVAMKPRPVNAAGWLLSFGGSILYGGMEQFTNKIYTMEGGKKDFSVDSSANNVGVIAPRQYFGADAQFVIPNGKGRGSTQFRAEYIRGTQTSTALDTETPGTIPMEKSGAFAPLYIRPFDGAYFSFLQHLGSARHQLVMKYDWYDPNRSVKGRQIGDAAAKYLTPADIRFDTFGFGYVFYFNENMKATIWYDRVWNEGTSIDGFGGDIPDNVFTTRIQYRF